MTDSMIGSNVMGSLPTHRTHTNWTFWYHNPIDKNWNLKSYKINSSHKKIINNLDFLKLFFQIIFL